MLRTVLLPLAALSLATLTQACSPLRDPDLQNGYLPPVPCWLAQDTACRPWFQDGVDYVLDEEHGLLVVHTIEEYCAETIAEELTRAEDGRKTFGWEEEHGTLTVIEGGILVISGMSEEAVELYKGLEYK